MSETDPEYLLTYRKKIAEQFFQMVESAESGSVVGAASMGKTRLIGFVLKPETRQHYLGRDANNTLLMHVDCNRMSEHTEWGLYELMLMTLAETCEVHPEAGVIVQEYFLKDHKYSTLIKDHNTLSAQRFLELMVHLLCDKINMKMSFLFDEFDQTLRDLPAKTFANLRGLRDRHKSKLCFILFLRGLPKMLRDINEHEFEGFYELLSKSTIGLTPYEIDECNIIIRELEQRFHFSLSSSGRSWVLRHCAGHPGLLQALFHIQRQQTPTDKVQDDSAWIATRPTVSEECRKIFLGLLQEESRALLAFERGQRDQIPPEIYELLCIKGIISFDPHEMRIFSPVFQSWIRQQTSPYK